MTSPATGRASRDCAPSSPELLLTAHFPVMRGVEVDAFLAARCAFVDEVETAVAEAGARGLTELWDVTRDVDARLGPVPGVHDRAGASVRYFLGAGVPA
jgi:hypothetical protein